MNKQRKHSFTSFLSFFQISAEETVSSRLKKCIFFLLWKKQAYPGKIGWRYHDANQNYINGKVITGPLYDMKVLFGRPSEQND